MREFYRIYESEPEVLADAMTIGWTQNVVILEAELIPQERAWYIKAAGQFGWSKLELQQRIADNAHLEIVLDFADDVCYTEENTANMECAANDENLICVPRQVSCTIMQTFAEWEKVGYNMPESIEITTV